MLQTCIERINVCLTATAGNRAGSVCCKTYTINGSGARQGIHNTFAQALNGQDNILDP